MEPDIKFLEKFEFEKEWRRMLSYPRVIRKEDLPTVKGKNFWIQFIMRWTINSPATSISSFIQHLGPGAASQKHGHVAEAFFYVLEGKGYEIHDGKRYDWEAGDVVIVHPGGCVHQHFNASKDKRALIWVFHCSPLYQGLNLRADRLLDLPPGQTMEEYRSVHPVKVYHQFDEKGVS